MPEILDIDLSTGRMLNDSDLNSRSAVAVIGTDIVDNLFPGMDPLGKEIRIEGELYTVVGVREKAGKDSGPDARQLCSYSHYNFS